MVEDNVFELSNARDMTASQLASEFIWTDTFERLFSKRNQIILGARGTGKTAFAKMLSFDCLSKFDDKRALNKINQKSFIATFIPFKPEFLSKLKTIPAEGTQSDIFFIWGVNLSSCSRFIATAKFCLKEYSSSTFDYVSLERKLSIELSKIWLDEIYESFSELESALINLEFEKNYSFNKFSFGFELSAEDLRLGHKLHTDLFLPIKIAIRSLSKLLNIHENTTWAICLDEAEVLTNSQWELINTQLRTFTDVVFKITTMPYKHKTLKTRIGENLNPKHDFDYIYLDRLGTRDKSAKDAERIIQEFAKTLFDKKISNTNLRKSGINLQFLLGKSDLTDNSINMLPHNQVMPLIERYCNNKTLTRAKSIYEQNPNGKKFNDEIERKLRPLLIIKHYFESTTGQAYNSPKIFSGYDVAIKCCDGNPRKLINLFNRFITSLNNSMSFKPIEKSRQGRIIKNFSSSEVESIKAEENGFQTAKLLTQLGNYFKSALHNEKIGTEIVMSFEYDMPESTSLWESVKIAVDLGLLIPQVTTTDNDDNMPVKAGKFHFSGSISPQFFLPPRKGSVLKLSTILNRIKNSSLRSSETNTNEQMDMFND